jgi:hypothetical protein
VGTGGASAARHGQGRRGGEEEKDEDLEMEGRRSRSDGERSRRGDGSNQPKVKEARPVVCSLQHVTGRGFSVTLSPNPRTNISNTVHVKKTVEGTHVCATLGEKKLGGKSLGNFQLAGVAP